jgi:hypothetical protein
MTADTAKMRGGRRHKIVRRDLQPVLATNAAPSGTDAGTTEPADGGQAESFT